MSHSKKFVFFIISVTLGFGLSKMVEPDKKEEVEIELTDRELLPKIEKIKEVIVTKYLSEKDPFKKLEVSDEIMEKVILLFMANLGIKLTAAEQALVENPQSYEKYMQKVLQLCPSLPNNTGPEVFLNDGKDEIRQKLEDQLNTCKETYGGLGKKPKLKTDEQKKRFINFEDNIFKKFGRPPEQLFPFDIVSELWTEVVYRGKLQTLPKNFLNAYQGDHEGIYRTVSGEQGHIKIELLHHPNSKEDKILIKLLMVTKLGLKFEQTYEPKHPAGHSNTGKGPCRGLVLTYGSDQRAAHLVKVPGREGYFGRIYASGKMVSSFFVMKDFSKKKLNPRTWGRDRGYW